VEPQRSDKTKLARADAARGVLTQINDANRDTEFSPGASTPDHALRSGHPLARMRLDQNSFEDV